MPYAHTPRTSFMHTRLVHALCTHAAYMPYAHTPRTCPMHTRRVHALCTHATSYYTHTRNHQVRVYVQQRLCTHIHCVLAVVIRGCQYIFFRAGLTVSLPSVRFSVRFSATSCQFLERVVPCSFVVWCIVYSATLLYSMDVNTITVFISQNSESFDTFVKLIFEDFKREIQQLHNKNNELCNENKELQNSNGFWRSKTNDLKRRIDELRSPFSTSHDAELSDQVMTLLDYTREKISV